MLRKLILLLLLSPLSIGIAQKVELNIKHPSEVTVGQQFTISVNIESKSSLNNANLSDFKPMSTDGFKLLQNPYQQQGYSSVNGDATHYIKVDYHLQATKTGNFDLGKASVKAGDKTIFSKNINIAVAKQSVNIKSSDDKDIFIRVIPNRKSCYMGEPISASIKIYTSPKVDITGYEAPTLPAFDGFWREDIEMETNHSTQFIDGKRYQVITVAKYVLVPQKYGNLDLGNFSIPLNIRKQTGSKRVRSFFGIEEIPTYENMSMDVKSPAVRINVKALPAGAPADFKGIVGKYKLDVSLTKNEVKADEAITLQMKVSGSGNLKLMPNPNLSMPSDFENYDPEVKNSFKVSTSGISGSKKISYLMIPRYEGNYTIPAVSFSYFDPSQKKYKTLSKGPFEINVLAGDGSSAPALIDRPTVNQRDVKVLGKDIRYIKTDVPEPTKESVTWFGSISFYSSYIGSLSIAALLFFFLNKRKNDQENVVEYKAKNAGKQVQKRLKTAKTFLDQNNSTSFYKELLLVTEGYLEDKLKIGKSSITQESIKEILTQQKVSAETIEKLLALRGHCEMAQYAPVGGESAMQKQYDTAVEVMMALQTSLKKS